jgi:glycosyltransferase involved in cell wall biosynthesis
VFNVNKPDSQKPMVSIVMPCRNEENAVGECVLNAKNFLKKYSIAGEIIVADNQSSDSSRKIAGRAGAIIVDAKKKGYGAAYLCGLKQARGEYIIMGDCDGSYDFSETGKFLAALEEGHELVVGSRFAGKIHSEAMPFLRRHLGNPMLNYLFNTLFETSFSDTHCGFRGFRKNALEKLELKQNGMPFALEMLAKAKKQGLKIKEVPITYYPRKGNSKLDSFSDGFRHLNFMLRERFS